MTALQKILDTYREAAATEREKGTYFEELTICYLKNEATYKDLYSDVWTYADWAEREGLAKRDTGIDLVAKTRGTDEFHAIQCKLYAEDHTLQKSDIDSFFTASGKKYFTNRIIVCTTNKWSKPAEDALSNQHPPVNKIDLHDLESSQIDWAQYQPKEAPTLKPRKVLREHQRLALEAVIKGLTTADRGKLIMACGTGKTFASLKIAEKLAGKGKRVLFMVPSLALLSQTLTEWTQECATPLHSFAVCSDSDVGKKRKKDDDSVQTFTHELRYPATTAPDRLAKEMEKRHDAQHMSVVFSTYHSIEVLGVAQHEYGLPEFDLIICDEAHRTTGATFGGDDESHFVKVHENRFIQAAKRIYMTATPRIYGDSAKATAERDDITLCSMDNAVQYGKTLYTINFSEAVKLGLLCDYKVLVLAVEEKHVSRRIQDLLKDGDNQLRVDDAAKIVGCWKALSKQDVTNDLVDDDAPMKRAVAFCQVIDIPTKARTHKVSSRNIANMFQKVVESYQKAEGYDLASSLKCEAEHVDGSMNASAKEAKLDWLRAELPENTCRILSNVRCLSEGVDVPALDAVLFLTPRNSQVDVVQSVGRVMRTTPDKKKKRGYVILPVVIPADMEPHAALNDNVTYKVVWQVLQALRSHDDRFDAMVNKLDLIGQDSRKMEVIAITDRINAKTAAKEGQTGKNEYGLGSPEQQRRDPEAVQLKLEIGDIERAIYAKLVQKCGNRHHWEDWANDIAKIAQTHIGRIETILEDKSHKKEREAFAAFAEELRDDLNDSITDGEVIEMLAQHLITKPVFDALFEGYSFAENNPISQAMQGVLDVLQEHRLDKEADTLEAFYDSVKLRAEGIENAAGKQKIVVELYEKFFKNAFPKMTDRLGIVYTPVEVVDFIIHSVNDVLGKEFGQTIGSEGVHIIDPFTGTGTFITRLLQSGLITLGQLPHKYKNEIHANEIILLAYYIAAINIEAVYHTLVGGEYEPLEGICLTDTFQLYEKEDLISAMLEDNSNRRIRQKELDIKVIVGNPPYSAGQSSANDNNQNIVYPHLDSRINGTYADQSKATLSKGLYDSYIRAIRWASDRIGSNGVIGYVSGSGYLEKPAMDGLRKCLANEFSSIYVLNLRGDIRKNMLSKGRAKEGQNIFGSGSMTGIAITLFVNNENAHERGVIKYYDIGDDLTQDEKLNKLSILGSVKEISENNSWQIISPNQHGDWLKQRDSNISDYILIGDKKGKGEKLFENYSLGVVTNRDAWCYNASRDVVSKSISRMIAFYNDEVKKFEAVHQSETVKQRKSLVNNFITTDSTQISWTRALKNNLAKGVEFDYDGKSLTQTLYRPFTKRWLYFNRDLNEVVSQMPSFFPQDGSSNKVICVSGVGARSGFSVLISNILPDLQVMDNGQTFPLYLYKEDIPTKPQKQVGLFDEPTTQEVTRTKREAITSEGLNEFQQAYPSEAISKEDVFYYVYGLLHSPDYRDRFENNLSKELPRIPCVKTAVDFWAFSKAGRDLADLHLNYETVDMYPVTVDTDGKELTDEQYRVVKMKYGKGKDKTTLIYNAHITLKGIPLEAYDYVVNGKPALDWVVERQCVKTDKASGIVNDANDWAIETMHNPRYPLELFMRVITVSLETMKIVNGLPELDI
nr:type ISP restriction/modification enzyme [uncultured Pseudodesulfovibrio sp.]